MPRKKRSDETGTNSAGTKVTERLTNLVALLLVKGEPQAEQIATLVRAGFTNTEVAGLLGVTANAVNIAMHRRRRSR